VFHPRGGALLTRDPPILTWPELGETSHGAREAESICNRSISVLERSPFMTRSNGVRILVLGQTRIGTGYARIIDSLLPRLRRSFNLEQVVPGSPRNLPRAPWPVHILDETTSAHQRTHLLRIIRARRVDLLLIADDLSRVKRYAEVVQTIRNHVRVLVYGPVDGPVFDPEVANALLNVHRVVVYTTSQEDRLRGVLRRQGAHTSSGVVPRLSTIGLGVDTTIFRPTASRGYDTAALLDRRRVRRRLFGTDAFRNAFIVLNANRNVIRKRIDLTVAGFARFAFRKPSGVLLYLHMGDGGPSAWHLGHLIRAHSVEKRTLRPPPAIRLPSIPTRRLALLYNACDVGVNTSVAEGWGLVNWEHGATGAAQVIPDHTACAELWGEAALRIRSYRSLVTEVPFYEEFTVDPVEMASCLERLYLNREFLMEKSIQALHHTSDPTFSWDAAANAWRELLLKELQ
jgi:D-inositol-3-phosphate glycosyltransferase